MARNEFTKKTQREALARSGMKCEAIGAWYGLDAGARCNADLGFGVQFDHIVLDANSKDNSLENCASVCLKCHKIKTAKHDIPTAAKTVRQQDMVRGIRTKPSVQIKSAPFPKAPKPVRERLPELPRRSLYRRIEA